MHLGELGQNYFDILQLHNEACFPNALLALDNVWWTKTMSSHSHHCGRPPHKDVDDFITRLTLVVQECKQKDITPDKVKEAKDVKDAYLNFDHGSPG